MTEAGYVPVAGDVIWTDFDPGVRREQGGRRPAIVISPSQLYIASAFVLVCPITRTLRNFNSSVVLPNDFRISGEILTYQIRSIDTLARPIRFAGVAAPPFVLADVRNKLAALCGMEEF